VEIKRIFKHPLYKYPNQYNNIELLELGRRVEYDFDMYGDTPVCLEKDIEIEGKLGNIQSGNIQGNILEADVTIISNNDCKKALRYNTSENSLVRKQIDEALPQGLNYGLVCAQGRKRRNKNGEFTGACKGDPSGPLYTKDDKDRTTLVGIISGGIGCANGIPGWNTDIGFHSEWVNCIIETSRSIIKKIDIEKSCVHLTTKPKKCQEIEIEDLIFGNTRSVDDGICNEDGTFATESRFQPIFDPIFT